MLSLRNSVASHDTIHAVLCGDILEITIRPEALSPAIGDVSNGTSKDPETEESILNRSIARSQKMIRHFVNCNRLNVLHTLTFAPKHPDYFEGEKPFLIVPLEAQKEREIVLTLWRAFVRNMRAYTRKKGYAFKYVAVIERHTGKRLLSDRSVKEGTYHIHFCSNRVYSKRLLQAKWAHGFCNFSDWMKGRKSSDLAEENDLPPCDNPGIYMSKYTGKDMETETPGKKRYWASRNLWKPVQIDREMIGELFPAMTQLWQGSHQVELDEGRFIYIHKATYHVENSPYDSLRCQTPIEPAEIRTRKNRIRYELAKEKAFSQYRKEMENERTYPDRNPGKEFIQRSIGKKWSAYRQGREATRNLNF